MLTDASIYGSNPTHRSCELYLTRLATIGQADFPRINQSHSSIYDDVDIADAPIGAPYKVRVCGATPSVSWV